MHYLYILYSKTLDKFYIGSTSSSPEERLRRHLSLHKGFTSKAKDWLIVYVETYETLTEARKRELQIKGWKSHQRVRELITRSSNGMNEFEKKG